MTKRQGLKNWYCRPETFHILTLGSGQNNFDKRVHPGVRTSACLSVRPEL